ncbi:MAG: CDP-alcohol phosphatidyltransferase family protein [Terriglobales bacterium]
MMNSMTAATEFKSAARIQGSITAAKEKQLLIWMARRTPAWINADHLTLLGFAGQLLAGASLALARWDRRGLWLAIFFIAVNWLGDSLDGTLARVRNQQRPRYGFYVDHMVDTFGASSLMIGLAISGYAHWLVALAMLIAFLVLSIETYLATYCVDRFEMSHWLFGPTEVRILLIIGIAKIYFHSEAHLFGHTYMLFDIGGAIAAAGMILLAIIATVMHTRELYRRETI